MEKTHFGDIFKTKKEVEGKMEDLQKALGKGSTLEDMILEEENYRRLWKDTMIKEDTLQKQRSRFLWLKLGDSNTSFFHRSTSIHKTRNMIDEVIDDNNTKIIKTKEIVIWARNSFKYSYKEVHTASNREDRQWLIDSMPYVILVEENEVLMQ